VYHGLNGNGHSLAILHQMGMVVEVAEMAEEEEKEKVEILQ
jgi:hypothetical protein